MLVLTGHFFFACLGVSKSMLRAAVYHDDNGGKSQSRLFAATIANGDRIGRCWQNSRVPIFVYRADTGVKGNVECTLI